MIWKSGVRQPRHSRAAAEAAQRDLPTLIPADDREAPCPRRTGRSIGAVVAGTAGIAGLAAITMLSACGTGKSSTARSDDAVAAGLRAQKAGNISVASADYNQALALNPRNRAALYDLGLLDQLAGRTASAESRYRAVLALDPNYIGALFNLAIIRTRPAPQEAETLYQQVITLNPKDAGAYLNLGLLLKASGASLLAEANLAKAVSLDPSLAAAAGIPAATGPTTGSAITTPTVSPATTTTVKKRG